MGKLGKMFQPATPPKAPKPIPMPDEEQTREAAKRRQAELLARSGTNSTLLTDTGKETLG